MMAVYSSIWGAILAIHCKERLIFGMGGMIYEDIEIEGESASYSCMYSDIHFSAGCKYRVYI